MPSPAQKPADIKHSSLSELPSLQFIMFCRPSSPKSLLTRYMQYWIRQGNCAVSRNYIKVIFCSRLAVHLHKECSRESSHIGSSLRLTNRSSPKNHTGNFGKILGRNYALLCDEQSCVPKSHPLPFSDWQGDPWSSPRHFSLLESPCKGTAIICRDLVETA